MTADILSIDPGIKHLGLCSIESKTELIDDWGNLDLGLFPTEGMITQLSKLPKIYNCNDMLIERQPRINPKMSAFSKEIKMFLTIRKIDYKKNYKIIFYSSKFKNEIYDGDIPDEVLISSRTGKRKKDYDINKDTAVYIVKQIIHKQTDDNIVYFLGQTHKCKRDLADAFLQAISFSRRKNAKKSVVMMRRPSSKQKKYKKYSKSNLKYILVTDYLRNGTDAQEQLNEFMKKYETSIRKAFGVDFDEDDIYEIVPDEFMEDSKEI